MPFFRIGLTISKVHRQVTEESSQHWLGGYFLVSEQIYLQGDLVAIDKLDTKLRSDSWQLFRRLRWQLYADFPTHIWSALALKCFNKFLS